MSHLVNFVKFGLDCFNNMLTHYNSMVVSQSISKGFPQVALAQIMALFSICITMQNKW
jgi:hypothetical protein